MIKNLLILLPLTVLFACSANNINEEKEEVITLAPYQETCHGPFLQQCFVTILDNGERELFYEHIEGFNFEPGYEYKLLVNVSFRCDISKYWDCPQDISFMKYQLKQVLSKKPSNEGVKNTGNSVPPANFVKIPSSDKDISMFPKAKEGFKQQVYYLDKKPNELDYKVEIFAKKNILKDCNTHTLVGQFETKTVDGWGYNYHIFTGNGSVMSTRAGCLSYKSKKEDIVSVGKIVDYNSDLPLVIYVKKELDITYNTWQKDSMK